MKTVLAPNAPWPVQVERKKKKRPYRAKPTEVDIKFSEWLKKQGLVHEKTNRHHSTV